MPSIARDIRFGSRSLRKHLGLSLIAVFALTLGIGLTTTMFSIVYSVMMRGLPYRDADRIVSVFEQNLGRHAQRMELSVHDFADIRAQQRSFSEFGAFYSGTVNVSGTEKAERFLGTWTTASMFDIAGVPPLIGRTIRAGEDAPGGEHVAVISYRMWRNRFAGERAVIGKTLRANGMPYTIVGVMPERYGFPDDGALWLPLQLDPLTLKRGEGQHVMGVAKLKPGVSLDVANTDVNAIARRIATEHKEQNEGVSANVMTFIDGQLGPEPRQLLLTMLGAVFFVLLIACANVANLLLDRAAHRTKEVGIRTALGASRGAVVRQFLTEAFVLAAVGTATGVGAAYLGVRLFNRAIADTEPPFWLDIRLYPPVLLFAIGVALLATLVSGLLPALQASRTDIGEILKDDSRGASSFRIGRLSRSLVIFEIALSCALLVAAGLMIKSVTKIRNIDAGFTTKNIFTARVGFPDAYTDTIAQRQFFEQLEQRLTAMPGAVGTTLVNQLPGLGSGISNFALEGASYVKDADYPRSSTNAVTPGFFSTFELRVLQGRAFTAADRRDALPTAIVNQAFVAKFFRGGDPIGRRIRLGDSRSKAPWMTIVGVVPNTYSGNTNDLRPPFIFMPLAQQPSRFVSMAVRTASAPMAITPQIRDVVASLNRDIPIYNVYSLTEAIDRNLWFIRVFGTMFMIFGVIALFLAGVGLYAVMAFSVSRRTREVGIRMALGAKPGDVIGMVVRQGVTQLGVGMAAGLTLALGVAQLMTVVLFDVQPRDPQIFGLVVAVLSAAGLLACLIPARRATMVDPLIALRSD
ncbi:MAG TPA: ABC transporter permease [Gemmatimonadaceae bacterium]|nr:ABC transporter permease [Gemmatimonadaceae bacterium]